MGLYALFAAIRAPWADLPELQGRTRHLEHVTTRLENTMATQDDLDAVAVKLAELKDTLTADDAGIQAEIDTLQAANPALDLTGVQTALDALSGQVDATTALVPPAPGGDAPAA